MQVNQNINAANFLLVSSQTTQIPSASQSSDSSVDFASALKNANDNRQYQASNIDTQSQKSASQSATKNSQSVSENNEKSTSSLKNVDTSEQKHNAKQTTEKKDSVDTPNEKINHTEENVNATDSEKLDESVDIVENVEGVEELSNEELVALLEAVGELLQKVMEQFGLNVEEFSAKLEEFGMQPSDLLTQDGLKEFFLQMNNANVSDLVVDENLNMQLQSFMTSVAGELTALQNLDVDAQQIISDLDMDVEALLHKFSVDNVADDLTVVDTASQDEFEQNANYEKNQDVVASDEPEVIVTDKRSQTGANNTGSEHQQTDGKAQQNITQDASITESNASTQNTFENPVLQAIQNAVNNVQSVAVSEESVQQTNVVRQIVEQVRLNMNQQSTSLELQLYPEHLGRIQINIVSKQGVMTASIVAETESAKQAIESGLLNLKEAMEQQDLKVEAIEVAVSTMGFERNDEQQQSFDEKGSSNPRRKIELSELGEDDISVEDEVEVEKMKATGSSVSYMA